MHALKAEFFQRTTFSWEVVHPFFLSHVGQRQDTSSVDLYFCLCPDLDSADRLWTNVLELPLKLTVLPGWWLYGEHRQHLFFSVVSTYLQTFHCSFLEMSIDKRRIICRQRTHHCQSPFSRGMFLTVSPTLLLTVLCIYLLESRLQFRTARSRIGTVGGSFMCGRGWSPAFQSGLHFFEHFKFLFHETTLGFNIILAIRQACWHSHHRSYISELFNKPRMNFDCDTLTLRTQVDKMIYSAPASRVRRRLECHVSKLFSKLWHNDTASEHEWLWAQTMAATEIGQWRGKKEAKEC